MEEAPKGKDFKQLNFEPVIALMHNEPVNINDLMQMAYDNPGELRTKSELGREFTALYDPSTKIMHTNLPYINRILCPLGDRHIRGTVCEVCGEFEKAREIKEKTVYLDGYGYLYWGEEKLGFISQLFKSGGLLNTAKEEMTKKFKRIEEEGGVVTLSDAERIYEDLPSGYK
jgi:hypothetical protein